jgi:hypothetical protein
MTFAKDPRFLVRPMGGRRCLPTAQRMVLISVNLPPPQLSWLRFRAARDHVTVSALVRRAIAQMMPRDDNTVAPPDTCATSEFD